MRTKLLFKTSIYFVILSFVFFINCHSGMRKENEIIKKEEPETKSVNEVINQNDEEEKVQKDAEYSLKQSQRTISPSGSSKSKASVNKKDDFAQELSIIASDDTTFLDIYSKGKKLVKTADLKFKVNNVEKATYEIEKITRKFNGFIVNSDITTSKNLYASVPISSDSLKEVFSFYIEGYITIRLPYYFLDSALADFAKLFIFLDYRKIRVDDVTTTFLRNKFRALHKAEFNQRVKKAIDERSGKIYDVVEAEQTVLNTADRMIEDKIANYTLQDRVNYSTIVLKIYQNTEIFEEIVPDTRIHKYQPSVGMRFAQAFKRGWILLVNLFIGIAHLWSLILIGILLYFGVKLIIKYYRKK